MGKNDTLNDTLTVTGNITKDENFKDVLRYKAIAAMLIKFAIPEFNNESVTNIAKLIEDVNKKRPDNMSNTDILEDEVDFLPTESGTKGEKEIFHDTKFKLKLNNEVVEIKFDYENITAGIEMQNKTSQKALGYNPVSRAIYYGADLLRGTVARGDTYYTGIHKVYAIWFCTNDLELKEYPDIEGSYIHRYGFRRFYDNWDRIVSEEPFADLIEIVLVELQKLRAQDSEATEMVYTLFKQTSSVVDLIEKSENVTLTKIRKGVKDMIDYEERTRNREKIAREEEKLEFARKLLMRNRPIDEIAEDTGLSLQEVEQLAELQTV